MNIYQVFTRLFRVDEGQNTLFGSISENGCSKFNHFTDKALAEFRKMGITHLWFTGIQRHASCTTYHDYGLLADNANIVKGVAGSPYAIKDYFDVDPDLAENIPNRMAEFEQLIKRCHRLGLKVIIDFVPNHVSRQYFSQKLPEGFENLGANDNTNLRFHPANNFYYVGDQLQMPEGINFPYTQNSGEYVEAPAKATGNDVFHSCPSINDWYETVKINYGVDYENNHCQYFDPIPDTWNKMHGILEFWAKKGVDAFRVDMAEMVPIEFWKWIIGRMKEQFEDLVFIAEVYNPVLYQRFIYEGGFDYLYDKEQFYNYTRDIVTERASARVLTQCWQQQEGLGKYFLRFLENHDEQRIASPNFCGNPWNVVPAMIVAATMHQGPLMIYFGQEIGEAAHDNEGFSGFDGRTSIFDYWRIKEYQKWVDNGNFDLKKLSQEQQYLREFYVALFSLRNKYRTVLEGAFFDLMYANQNNLNADKVYAYLRHFDSQILLVVVNFDLYANQSFNLLFPRHALEVVGINKQSTLNMQELLWAEKFTQITTTDLMCNGFYIEIQPCNGYIFEIKVV